MRVEIKGTGEFRQLAKDLKQAGRGDLRRELAKSMKTGVKPIEDEMKSNVLGLASAGSRGGASARAKRAGALLRRKKIRNDKAKMAAHRASGLRAAAARTVKTKVLMGARSASVQIRSDSKAMPWGQKALPGRMNDGKWRHPVFDDKQNWVTQTVNPAGWFDRPATTKGPRARDTAIDTVGEYISKLV